MSIFPRFLFLLVLVSLSACASVGGRQERAANLATDAGFRPLSLRTDFFTLSGFYRESSPNQLTSDQRNPVLYIEGDGFAWIDRFTVSDNPTPRNPLALKLAVRDGSARVFYLARPCQFVDLVREGNCRPAFWTSARFAPDVIAAYDQALDKIAARLGNAGFHLVGFSGGGAVATLLAARRGDILSLRTVAGNLDHVALNRAKKVSPLRHSLNPMAVAPDLATLPQTHYLGGRDRVVPSWVGGNFVRAVGQSVCVQTQVVPQASHLDGWGAVWGRLHKKRPVCQP